MQKYFIKLLIFILSFLSPLANTLAQNNIAQKADSLFNTKKYSEAAKLYSLLYNDPAVNKQNISLKMAFIHESLSDYPRALYYLGNFYNISPNDLVFDKMNKIALENKYSGYDRSDFNFVLMIYQQYYLYILYILIFIGLVVIIIFFRKKRKSEPIILRQLILMFLYFTFLLLLINLPDSYKSAIVNKKSLLRNYPSNASPIIGNIGKGNKINIFGNENIWYKVLWNRKLVYINKKDIWILEN